ncbi:MAG: hypothetical protein KAS01_02855 [Candidatus Pacebacteria bacterium]|nr:hypothetical protein [Candidatus Paceibacterota bacterium]
MSEIEPKLDEDEIEPTEIDSIDANYVRELSQTGPIIRGSIHDPISGEVIRAEGGCVSCPMSDGNMIIIVNGKKFGGDIPITRIKMK